MFDSPRRFTSSEVCNIALVTLRQLQHWDEQAILSPPIESGKRSYSAHLAMGAMLYREMHERGFKMQHFRCVWHSIQMQNAELPHPARKWLMTDGKRALFLDDAPTVLAFLEQRRNPLFALIPLEPLEVRLIMGRVMPERKPPAIEGELRGSERLENSVRRKVS